MITVDLEVLQPSYMLRLIVAHMQWQFLQQLANSAWQEILIWISRLLLTLWLLKTGSLWDYSVGVMNTSQCCVITDGNFIECLCLKSIIPLTINLNVQLIAGVQGYATSTIKANRGRQ